MSGVIKNKLLPAARFFGVATVAFWFMAGSVAFSQVSPFPAESPVINQLDMSDLKDPTTPADQPVVAPALETDPRLDRGGLSFYEWDLPDPRSIPSLFFSPWTQALIKEYRRGISNQPSSSGDAGAGASSGARELVLGGITYRSEKDWTVWLNGQRVTPKAMPEQIHDLKVTGEYIDIKWYDSFTNIIFPVRLRPHQRFNLDTRIFLPG